MEFFIGKGNNVKLITVYEEQQTVETGIELFKFIKEKEFFKGEFGETYGDFSLNGENILFLGLGKKDKVTLNNIRKAFFKAAKELTKFKVDKVDIEVKDHFGLDAKSVVEAISEGFLQSEYVFDKYISKKKIQIKLQEVYIDIEDIDKEEFESTINEIKNIIEGIFLTRDLINERAINLYPEALADSAKENLEPFGVKVEVFNREQIESLNMKAFLAVSKGSTKEPKFIVMTYDGDSESNEKIAFVGKGVTYDSGGYSLKPSNSMDTMHCDMGGAGTVIGAIKAVAKSKLKKNIVGVIAACENMISGDSYKPGDIIGSMSGKTIQVLNTDAEGRLTLADALYYTSTVVKADKIIELATLTGACVVGLGSVNTGAITNNDCLMSDIKKASELSGEPIWELPTNEEYTELIKSEVADLKNVGGGGAGTITAGLFLREFVEEKPWVHLDIAGTAYLDKDMGYLPKGATGVHVKTFYNMIKNTI